jgi:hypothetical protein
MIVWQRLNMFILLGQEQNKNTEGVISRETSGPKVMKILILVLFHDNVSAEQLIGY